MRVEFSLTRKGQIFSFDFIVAFSIFVLLLTIFTVQVGQYIIHSSEIKERQDMDNEAYEISDVFFREGVPSNWTDSNVKIIGLESNERISWDKIKKFENLGYQKTLILLGSKYDYNLQIFNKSSVIWEFGKNPENYSSIAKIVRISILNNTIISIQVLIFK
ncbi:MAG: hypothetical protein B6U88_02925 [Candidatus Aenigmarchaeota archaeon ex4484_56]|nr:MAG: hypothetical protein B6U88_02925 [Candidatus Aenigmarchaeota archaeon ex4484_56]